MTNLGLRVLVGCLLEGSWRGGLWPHFSPLNYLTCIYYQYQRCYCFPGFCKDLAWDYPCERLYAFI